MDISSLVIKDFLSKINSEKPIPSAGSSLSVTGSLGASLLGLTAKITLRKVPKCDHDMLKELAHKSEKASQRFLELGEEDILVYKQVIANEPGSVEKAIEIPLTMARMALDLVKNYEQVVHTCYKPVKGDAWLGVELLRTCVKSAVYIAVVNVDFFKPENREEYLEQIFAIQDEIGVQCSPDGCTLQLDE
ncbi:MAG: cyclodeaminase/cyclohydrolase family protein [Clostridia bacterium]|nr:cyclodeaminase/cyclohydrolase family protein [Clostridia bacterium]